MTYLSVRVFHLAELAERTFRQAQEIGSRHVQTRISRCLTCADPRKG